MGYDIHAMKNLCAQTTRKMGFFNKADVLVLVRRFDKIRTITWNIKVLNRLRYSPDTWCRCTILRHGIVRVTVQI
ncbi:MAG: hypothetical protein F4010_00070 [Cenarchaeum sp. SB0669_bin_11]|nr:hypothetical protein [Cenarchaeum sp. SB0675_bin_21]MYL10561.1 hypothetical protein [Cenarchaeum sp. SB0669_bin_11]